MKRIRNKTLLAMAAATVLLLAGCTKEPYNEGLGEGTYLSLSIDGLHSPATAASSATLRGASTRATAVVETAVNDLWVLQFQMTAGSTTAGTLVNKSYISSVTDLTKIKFTPTAGSDMALYLVANTGSSTLFSATANGATLATVKATAMTATTTAGNNFPANTSANLPMVGQSANLTLSTATVPVTLTRTVAKIVLTVKNGLTTGYPRLTVTSTQLKNAPKTYSTQVVNAANGFTGTTYYPATGTSNFTSYTAVSGNVTAAGTTSTYYVAPNVRGIGTNSNDRLKGPATAPSGQGAYCTYVEILGTAQAKATSPAVDVCYRLYLGGNNTNNFNLYSNTAYRATIELTGLSAADARLTIATDKFDLIAGGIDDDHTSDAGDGWWQPTIGDLRDGGIVYWVDPADPTKYKVFSLDEGSNLKWAAQSSYELGAAGQSLTDGKANVDAMKDYSANNKTNNDATKQTTGVFATDFPAAAFCDRKNTGGVTGWYLPAKDELVELFQAYRDNTIVLDGAITANLGTAIPASGRFWSSTEDSNYTSLAWYVNFSYSTTNSSSKVNKEGSSYSVRCVRSTVPSPPAIGDLRDGGIVYWVDPADATKYKVFSLDQGSSLTWSPKTTYVLGAAGQSLTDGKGNVAAMKAYSANNKTNNDAAKQTTGVFATDFPVAEFCDRKNTGGVTGWYLPAKDELVAFHTAYKANQTVIAGAITTNLGTAIPASGYFWSSTEDSIASFAWCVYFASGNTEYNDKGMKDDSTFDVRCVRAN